MRLLETHVNEMESLCVEEVNLYKYITLTYYYIIIILLYFLRVSKCQKFYNLEFVNDHAVVSYS